MEVGTVESGHHMNGMLPAGMRGQFGVALRSVAAIGLMTSLALCACGCEQEACKVIAWAKENGMSADGYQAGQIPDENWDEQEWIRRGRSIPHAERILQQLLRTNDERLERILAVRALGAVGTADSVPLLKTELNKANWELLRAEIIFSLGQIGGQDAGQVLAFQVEYGKSTSERYGAALALVRIGDPSGVEPIKRAIESLRTEQERMERALADLHRKAKVGTADVKRQSLRPTLMTSQPESGPEGRGR